MASTRCLTVFVVAAALCAVASHAQEKEPQDPSTTSIANWAAPPFWSGASQATSSSESDSHSKAGIVAEPLPFVGLTPCRAVDTRDSGFPPGYGPPALAPSTPRDITMTGRCGIPASAGAVSLNITVAATQGPGFILIYPQGGTPVLVSTLNYVAGQAIANAAIVPLGTGGGITVTAGVSGTELIIDTNGYYGTGLLQPRVEPHAVSPNLIGGSRFNSVTPGAIGATIGGGGGSALFFESNNVTDDFGTVAGGRGNVAGDNMGLTVDRPYGTVGGGLDNVASGDSATVGGGISNVASGPRATVAGGDNNTAGGIVSVVGGGVDNNNSGNWSTIAGGALNTLTGSWAAIPGGAQNEALGHYSFAAGRQARASHNGSFVWNDSTDPVFASSAANEFNVRASGGTRFFSNTTFDTGVLLAAGGNAWSPVSDRAVKENFKPVDGREVVRRLADLPVESWNLKSQDPSIRHIGPMAQDFYAAFCVGEDDKHITTTDADGVALAAIQGLYALLREKNEEISAQRKHIEMIEARLAAVEKRDLSAARP